MTMDSDCTGSPPASGPLLSCSLSREPTASGPLLSCSLSREPTASGGGAERASAREAEGVRCQVPPPPSRLAPLGSTPPPLRFAAREREAEESCERAAPPSRSEATERERFIAEAKTWLLTPFRDQGNVKGPNGCVDCAMLLVASAQAAGLLDPAYDPRPYPPQFHLHRGEELFLDQIDAIIAMRGRGREVHRAPIPGDVIVYRVGRCFSHGGIVIEAPRSSSEAIAHKELQLLHAYYKTGHVAISGLNEVELATLPDGKPRPFKLFDLWA